MIKQTHLQGGEKLNTGLYFNKNETFQNTTKSRFFFKFDIQGLTKFTGEINHLYTSFDVIKNKFFEKI